MSDIKITFLGGAGEIGASCALLEVGNYRLLIDCGVRFDPRAPLPDLDRLTGKRLDLILVTHAHSDHTGALPVVHSAFPGVPILMTPPTIELVRILQKDALKLMDQAFAREGEIPLYQGPQVESMLEVARPIHHLDRYSVGDLDIRFLPASHILGASMIHITCPQGRVLFTGDFSVTAQKTVPALDHPPFPVDLLITESTYGARLHSDRKAAEAALVSNIGEVVMEGGRVLIPCFAIGRAQEVLLVVKQAIRQKKLPAVPVFVDGMVRYVCNIYTSHERYVSRTVAQAGRHGHVFYDRHIQPVASPEERPKILATSPCVIIASSGMLSGGPSAFYAMHLAPCPRDAIFITGYQDEESPGRSLLSLAEKREENAAIRLQDQKVDVHCRFASYNLSAHADRMQICGLVAAFAPKTTVLVHGDTEAKQSLKDVLPCRDVEIGWDGLSVTRAYRDVRAREEPATPDVSRERILNLIGEEPGPFSVPAMAQSFCGRRLSRESLSLFASEVEATGILKRDDNRRSLFKRVKEIESPQLDPEAERIKRENPKGILNEMCLKHRLAHPQKFLAQKEDGRYYCKLTLAFGTESLETSQHAAKSKILAEQLAARELAEMLAPRLTCPETPPVPQSEGEAIAPHRESEDIAPNPARESEGRVAPPAKFTVDPAARPTINRYLQTGLLRDFQCHILGTEGPPHAPIFTMRAEAVLSDGRSITGEAVTADTKKSAQLLAATALLEAVHACPHFVPLPKPEPPRKNEDPSGAGARTLHELIEFLKSCDRRHGCALPVKYLKRLAGQILQYDKLGEEEWIEERLSRLHEQWEEEKTRRARQYGYYPFVQFTPDIYQAIAQEYGDWVLESMRAHLDDPTRIFPNWAAQFAATLTKIGRDQCHEHREDLYRFVTGHPAWEESAAARDKLSTSLNAAKLQRLRRRLSDRSPPEED